MLTEKSVQVNPQSAQIIPVKDPALELASLLRDVQTKFESSIPPEQQSQVMRTLFDATHDERGMCIPAEELNAFLVEWLRGF